MKKQIIIVLIAAVLIIIAAGAAYALTKDSGTADSGQTRPTDNVASPVQPTPSPAPQASEPSVEDTITTGTVGCLEPSDAAGPQNASCAIGLSTDDGTSYGLNAADPALTGSIPSGQRVEVIGAITERAIPGYDAAGVIQVKDIKRLP